MVYNERDNPSNGWDTPERDPHVGFKEGCKKYILKMFEEYVEASEDQDGYAYWNKFKNEKELFDDFVLYFHILSADTPRREPWD